MAINFLKILFCFILLFIKNKDISVIIPNALKDLYIQNYNIANLFYFIFKCKKKYIFNFNYIYTTYFNIFPIYKNITLIKKTNTDINKCTSFGLF